jgi:hypothetical protein
LPQINEETYQKEFDYVKSDAIEFMKYLSIHSSKLMSTYQDEVILKKLVVYSRSKHNVVRNEMMKQGEEFMKSEMGI